MHIPTPQAPARPHGAPTVPVPSVRTPQPVNVPTPAPIRNVLPLILRGTLGRDPRGEAAVYFLRRIPALQAAREQLRRRYLQEAMASAGPFGPEDLFEAVSAVDYRIEDYVLKLQKRGLLLHVGAEL